MTLTCPPLEKTDRPVPSRLPVNGSKIIPCLSAVVPPSVVGIRMGVPAELKIGAPSMRLKLPLRESAVGTDARRELPTRSKVPSQFPKKNSLFFLIGPPRLPPSMFRLPFGLFVTPARFSSHVNVRKALLSYIANAVPRRRFVPDFVITVTAAPPVIPCSASKLLVEMFTSWMLSTGGTYTA